jgi:subtilisin family serine protease
MAKAAALIGIWAALFLVAAAGASGAVRPAHGLTSGDSESLFVPGELIVRYRAGVDRAGRAAVVNSIDATRKQFLLVPRAELLELPDGVSVDSAVRALEATPDVQYAEPNRIYHAQGIPNDTRFAELWGLNNTGQQIDAVAGTPDADIDAPEAWEQTTGSKDVVVAVVDTGIAYDHPELVDNVLRGSGWDFIGNDNDPRDLNGHGTHVAGTIGAKGNNAGGVSGVNWNVSLMPVRVLDANGSGTTASVTNGYVWAVEHGAKVVNASLGCMGFGCFSSTESAAISGHPNTLFVVAAGNAANNNDAVPTYPCNYPAANLICVAATDENDVRRVRGSGLLGCRRHAEHLGKDPGVEAVRRLERDRLAGDAVRTRYEQLVPDREPDQPVGPVRLPDRVLDEAPDRGVAVRLLRDQRLHERDDLL